MRLYVEGHNVNKGFVVSYELYDHPPVRFIKNRAKAFKLVERYNRLFDGKYPDEETKQVYERVDGWRKASKIL